METVIEWGVLIGTIIFWGWIQPYMYKREYDVHKKDKGDI